jgi:hypothetical protein
VLLIIVKDVLIILLGIDELRRICLTTSHETSVRLGINTSVPTWGNAEDILAPGNNIIFLSLLRLNHQTVFEVKMSMAQNKNLLSCIVFDQLIVISSFPVIFFLKDLNALEIFRVAFNSACLVIHVEFAIC